MFDTCGYCHGNKSNLFFGFTPGDRYEDFALPFLISEPIPANDPQGEFWPDGRPSRFNRNQALTLSGCFQRGEATCTSCHRVHGTPNAHMLKVAVEAPDGSRTKQSDVLCTQCHSVGSNGAARAPATGETTGRSGGVQVAESPATFANLSAHTHHAADSPGSRCVECHMSDVNWRLITRRRDHSFQPPVPEMTSRYGVPNARTTCHEDKSPEWAARTMDEWYGNGARRRAVVAVADVMYRAGSADTTVLPDVAHLAADRSHGALIRASAAEFTGQLIARANPASPNPAITNALIGAASDPEPMVRVPAVRALALVRAPQIPPVLIAHLTDAARLVRVAAAEGLMDLWRHLAAGCRRRRARARAGRMGGESRHVQRRRRRSHGAWMAARRARPARRCREGIDDRDCALFRHDARPLCVSRRPRRTISRALRRSSAKIQNGKKIDPACTETWIALIAEAEKRNNG